MTPTAVLFLPVSAIRSFLPPHSFLFNPCILTKSNLGSDFYAQVPSGLCAPRLFSSLLLLYHHSLLTPTALHTLTCSSPATQAMGASRVGWKSAPSSQSYHPRSRSSVNATSSRKSSLIAPAERTATAHYLTSQDTHHILYINFLSRSLVFEISDDTSPHRKWSCAE